jgi:hypothetical protein
MKGGKIQRVWLEKEGKTVLDVTGKEAPFVIRN